MSRVTYRIRVDGAVPRSFFEDFSQVTVAGDAASTTLLADLADMSELLDLLDALRRDGLVLVEVRRDRAPNLANEKANVEFGIDSGGSIAHHHFARE